MLNVKEYAKSLVSNVDITVKYSILADQDGGLDVKESNGKYYYYISISPTAGDENQIKSTIIHELIHVLQFLESNCTELKALYVPFSTVLSDEKFNFVKKRYPEEVVEFELQAFGVEAAFARDPKLVEMWIRDKFCPAPKPAPTAYAIKCAALLRERNFFNGTPIKEVLDNNGGMGQVILNYLHTPWGMLNLSDYSLAEINKTAREDLIARTIKGVNSFSSTSKKNAYVKCVKYWVEHRDILSLF